MSNPIGSGGDSGVTANDGVTADDDAAGAVVGPPGCRKGTIAADTLWPAAGGPVSVCGSITVASGATLTIEPGATVELGPKVVIVVANGGRLVAEGTEASKILFTHPSGSAGAWGNITINGSVGSPETRIAHARFEFNLTSPTIPVLEVSAGTVWFDHLSFGNTASPYIGLDGASFVITDSEFPTATAKFEPVHGTGGIKSGGHGVVNRCFFGGTIGYNDVVDFTGGNRPGQPIVHFINNVFSGGEDDLIDLDGTDAWVEGNIFLHDHRNNGTPDSAGAISGGATGRDTSQITVMGNIMYDCDFAVNAKEGNFYTFINNTVVHQTHMGGNDIDGAVANLVDTYSGPEAGKRNGTRTAEGAGVYLESNILYDVEKLVRNQKNAIVTFTGDLMSLAWAGPGMGNSTADPVFKHVPKLSETVFKSWAEAQVMREWLGLQAGSPGIGTGPNGRDKGGVIPVGASISGEPDGTTKLATATLTVGVNRTGSGIPAGGWPNGSGYTDYKWRLDGGAWSAEAPIAVPISLTGLGPGEHFVEVTGKRDSGLYQDDPVFGADAVPTRSRTWTVAP